MVTLGEFMKWEIIEVVDPLLMFSLETYLGILILTW
jgi:hypothetical protein